MAINDTWHARFKKLWAKEFTVGNVPPPTNQQLLGVFIILLSYPNLDKEARELVEATFPGAFPAPDGE